MDRLEVRIRGVGASIEFAAADAEQELFDKALPAVAAFHKDVTPTELRTNAQWSEGKTRDVLFEYGLDKQRGWRLSRTPWMDRGDYLQTAVGSAW